VAEQLAAAQNAISTARSRVSARQDAWNTMMHAGESNP
jgi:hypothetical protein